MQFQLNVSPWNAVTADWLILGLPENASFAGPLAALDQTLGGQLTRLRESGDFAGKHGDLLAIRDVPPLQARRLLLVGLGSGENRQLPGFLRAMTTAARHVSTKKVDRVAVGWVGLDDAALVEQVQTVVFGMSVGCVGQDLYRAERKRHAFENVQILVDAARDQGPLRQAINEGQIVSEAVNLVRELVNEPARVIYPASFADRAVELAKSHGLNCEVLDETAIEAERMGALLAVASGSNRPPRLVFLEYNGGPSGAPVLALVGKGVTFDSGGLSIKNTENMLTMKCDMAGAATALATIIAISRLKLPIRVMALMGLVENMTGGSAMKLGDVLTARSGTTIEVLNTDAEGRLVLADVLDYSLSRGADYLIDLATLTGACVVALGEDVAGAMTNNRTWCDFLLAAASKTGEDVWQLPMHEHFGKLIESDVADIKNVGGRWGGATTAAKFLERFVKDKPWVHLDIAGPAFASSDKPHREAGGTGCMVRTLIEVARQFPHFVQQDQGKTDEAGGSS